jgi:hypothetical protein
MTLFAKSHHAVCGREGESATAERLLLFTEVFWRRLLGNFRMGNGAAAP